MAGGLLYVSTPLSRILALNPSTGAIRWTFDPDAQGGGTADGSASRGVAFWRDAKGRKGKPCSDRIFLGSVDGRLISLDAQSGQRCREFGSQGEVDLTAAYAAGLEQHFRVSVSSPPVIIGDVIVVGSTFEKNHSRHVPPGLVLGFDARTGTPRWSFDPTTPETAGNDGVIMGHSFGGANTWSLMSVDEERDLVFLPTSSAAPDFFGGNRLGNNEHANSVVALRGTTGRVVWSYQVVRHDLWDYDVAAQPLLLDYHTEDETVPAVLVGTKMGFLFLLHRENGEPILPVSEKPVPPSDVPGESAWPTQPFPIGLPPLHSTLLEPDSAFGVTPSERESCRKLIQSLRHEGIYTPPSFQGTVVWPGLWGGINWDGLAWDPVRRRLVTTIKRMAMVVQLHPRDASSLLPSTASRSARWLAQDGTPYLASWAPLVSPSGVPCVPPPWGIIQAIDLSNASIPWQRPLGIIPNLRGTPGAERWGSILFGGALLTGGGLAFIGASQDDRFRAIDTETGAVLWDHSLPAGGQATPMSYVYQGKQYVVIVAAGRAGIGSPGDFVVAFSLPD